MGLLQTNDIPPNPLTHPDEFQKCVSGQASIELAAEDLELPGEARYKLLKDSSGSYFWDGARLYRLIMFGGNTISYKDIETGKHGLETIHSKATMARLMDEHRRDAKK